MGSFLSSPATDADLLASPDAYDSRSLRTSVEDNTGTNSDVAFLCHPLGDLGVTYTVHLWLVGKRVVDFL